MFDPFNLTVDIVLSLVIIFGLLTTMAYMTWFERRVISRLQARIGPNTVGWQGLLQPLADAVKLFFKEDIVPAGANKAMFALAPMLTMVVSLIGFAVIPFGPNVTLDINGLLIKPFVIADINIGILYILAIASIGAYGIILGGWSSNSKYSLLGGLRSAAQVISYELNVGLAIVGVLLLSGSLSLVEITEAQAGGFWHWFIWGARPDGFFPIHTQVFAFVVFLISGVAETNRIPFDLPEAESELVAGFFTEYSGMKFAFFVSAEYASMVLVSCVAASLFLGGWNAPYPGTIFEYIGLEELAWIEHIMWFAGKVYFFLFVFIWLRATLPRLRYDQLMRFGWKVLLPIALANIIITAITVYFFPRG